MLGNRGIFHDGWIASTTPAAPPWSANTPDADPITGYKWELYNVVDDPTEARNLEYEKRRLEAALVRALQE
jgi:arylsulfatase A-like enzyme